MATYDKRLLSGSINGRQIVITQLTSPGTTIHTAVAGTNDFDEVWLYAGNTANSDIVVTFELGGTTNPDDRLYATIPSKSGLVLVLPGLPFNNSVVLKGFATLSGIMVTGFVNRITA